jgi:hypothetical protein
MTEGMEWLMLEKRVGTDGDFGSEKMDDVFSWLTSPLNYA